MEATTQEFTAPAGRVIKLPPPRAKKHPKKLSAKQPIAAGNSRAYGDYVQSFKDYIFMHSTTAEVKEMLSILCTHFRGRPLHWARLRHPKLTGVMVNSDSFTGHFCPDPDVGFDM